MGVKIKKWNHFRGELPTYHSELASGFDVRAQLDGEIDLAPGQRVLIPTGLSFAIPPGFELQARPRSGWAIREGLSLLNSPGTVDADYRGEVKIIVVNLGEEIVKLKDQDRLAQM
ncbi:MAG: dUTP diphosphatase, partial [Bdellovibrionales bacterium]|nr:dUTP diphosphatase [Bdellovibrionales bacterium]